MDAALETLKGKLLLDGGKLAGSFFHRAVVLICEHNSEGAMGLVLNKETENQLAEVLPEEVPDILGEERLYLGGPVQTTALSFVYSPKAPDAFNVLPGLSIGHDLDTLLPLAQKPEKKPSLRVFAGYAGWSAGQLESEMERDAWVVHPATAEWVFSEPASALWHRILMAKGGAFRLIAEAPDDLSTN